MDDQKQITVGISCPWCPCTKSEITHTRRSRNNVVRRRRKCADCKRGFWTIEQTPSRKAT